MNGILAMAGLRKLPGVSANIVEIAEYSLVK
jgi:hypothetical protein